MSLDPRLLEILACPQDKGPLYYLVDENALYNPRLKLRYDVRDGIPIMLVSMSDSENDRTRGIAAGADAFLSKKECASGRLLTEITSVVARRQGASA